MHKKKILVTLCTVLFLTSCSSSATNTLSITPTNSSVPTATYKTEDVKITTYQEAIARLKEGNERFVTDHSELINVTSERRKQLMKGQTPYATIISCSDSRVTPVDIFDIGLGELFEIRIAGNVLDNDALGSIEYGVEHLHTPLIVIMGHESCGAVTAAYNKLKKGTTVDGHINDLVDKILPNIQDTDSLNEAIDHNADAVKKQIEEDKIVKELVKEGKVKVVKAYYSLDGKVTFE